MDSLRLTLVIIGLVVVVGIYIKFRSSDDDLIFLLKKLFNPENKNISSSEHSVSDEDDLIPVLTPIEDEPDFSDFEALSKVISGRDRVEEYTKQQEITFTAVEDTTETGPESLLIILYIMSPKGHVFTGEGIHAVMTSAGLKHGEHQIYHYLHDNMAVFSIANAVEPGFFDSTKLKDVTTPGLAVFLQLPGPVECRRALDDLLEISKRLAEALSGELCDENRSVLTQQTISHLKDKVETYRLKQQTSQRQKRH
ncbi:MAG: cell division protein ZipA C-terminal FtsZ-binding domain-containing protein [Gammaproteobacteria bacterium]|nr:cell division protein ZipA C-terminal FtsZ-binding domain-containing protein [Gammaproteobacteria bacterium]